MKDLQNALGTKSVIVMISAKHLCVSSRGIKDKASFTTTVEYGGEFAEQLRRNEFYNCLLEKSINL
jgi:GTP cyclohydrolase I